MKKKTAGVIPLDSDLNDDGSSKNFGDKFSEKFFTFFISWGLLRRGFHFFLSGVGDINLHCKKDHSITFKKVFGADPCVWVNLDYKWFLESKF